MKLLTALAVLLLLLQAGHLIQSGPSADPAHLRFQRAITPSSPGPACAVIDGDTFAHSASRTAEDLRLFDSAGNEVPYALTESSSQPEPPAPATILNLGTLGNAVVFDLAMPARPYSEIDLRLNARDFLASAHVTDKATGTDLGTFTLFDLTSQHLARSTALQPQEATFRALHVTLRFTTPSGDPQPLPPTVVQGADVPASREAQTLYTAVMSTSGLRASGADTTATFHIPAHVPIERVTFALDPAFQSNFIRSVDVKTYTAGDSNPADELTGDIFRVDRPTPAALDTPAIHDEHLSLNAVIGANLRDSARVIVTVHNGNDRPLPLHAIQLEMRERRVCFDAQPAAGYTLRYGDPALRAPVYDYARLFNTAGPTHPAPLGPEQPNPHFTPRADTRPYTERHPELLWIALLAVVAILGATAIGSVKHQRRIQ